MVKKKLKKRFSIWVKLDGLRCLRCGYTWLPRGKKLPKVCPKCKNPYWKKPRKRDITQSLYQSIN
jgi:rubrerythrin